MNTHETDMKDIWRDENERLEEKVVINERLLRTITIDNAASRFEKQVRISKVGRNLALVYCVISLIYSIRVLHEFLYSVPAFAGALAMLWSFFSHAPLKRLNFESSSVLEVQKSIWAFRAHTDKMKPYDMSIVVFWLLTLIPAFALRLGVAIYNKSGFVIIFLALIAVLTGILHVISKPGYNTQNKELTKAEQMLARLKDFDQA